MSIRLILYLTTISGIFRKSDDLDILPPPPPFPEIGKDEKELRAAERIREKEEKKRAKELEQKRKEEEKRKLEERRRKDKLREGKKKKVFDFFHGLGLVKTEKEKNEIRKIEERKRRDIQKQKELEFKRRTEEERTRQKEIERQQRQDEKRKQKELSLKRKEEEKRGKEDTHFVGKQKLEIPELEEIEKEIERPDLASAEEEIQKAIQGMKIKKRPSIVKRLWKKKEKVKEKIETPEVMPRTYDKIDYVELIEEKMHKARLALMNFKFDDAKRIYIEVMRMYNDLEQKKKAKVYEDIKDLYYERKSAEKFAK